MGIYLFTYSGPSHKIEKFSAVMSLHVATVPKEQRSLLLKYLYFLGLVFEDTEV